MVYFGERRFRSARPGVTSRERARVLVPAGLLFAMSLMILIQQWSSPVEDSLPLRPATATGKPSPASTGPDEDLRMPGDASGEGGGRDPGHLRESPLADSPLQDDIRISDFEQNVEPKPYEPNPAVLLAVRDHQVAEPGFPEQEGLIELFHRWRSGPAVPVEVFTVAWKDLLEAAPTLRARRTTKTFALLEEPLPRFLPDNRSGVRRYWEAFARDLDGGHIVRLDFIDRPEVLRPKDEVEAEVDFLRLHRYTPMSGSQDVIVPEYVAGEIALVRAAPREKGNWDAFLLAGGLSFLGLGILLLQSLRSDGSTARRRRGGRVSPPARKAGAPPTSPPPSPQSGTP